MKLLEFVKNFDKEIVYDSYSRILFDGKNYNNISRKKMGEEILEFYKTPNHLTQLCTERELKYLSLILERKIKGEEFSQYQWEIEQLEQKFILVYGTLNMIYEELVPICKRELQKVDFKKVKENDKKAELFVGYIKMMGSMLIHPTIQILSVLAEMTEEECIHYLFENKLFHFYVEMYDRYISSLEQESICLIYQDDINFTEEIDEQRQKYAMSYNKQIDIEDMKQTCRNFFYYGYNINHPTVNKFYKELKKKESLYSQFDFMIQRTVLLNLEREPLMEWMKKSNVLSETESSHFFQLMNDALDEMPSGVLNGLTPKEMLLQKEAEKNYQKEKTLFYQKQKDAHLSDQEVTLFYKLYFGLLYYTNQKYRINPQIKNLHKPVGINPHDIREIVEKFWMEKDKLISEFMKKNPLKFNQEELNMVQEFTKGKRGLYILIRYDAEYTVFMDDARVYMVKGLNCNIDDIISNDRLPVPMMTTLIPFKNHIVYDGMLSEFPISIGIQMKRQMEKDASSFIKYYHL